MAVAPSFSYTGSKGRNIETAMEDIRAHIAALDTGSYGNMIDTHCVPIGNDYYQATVIYA